MEPCDALNRGDVFWCKFPTTDRRRPVVILSRDWAIERLTWITVAPVTSAVRLGPVFVDVSLEDGLFEDSVVNCDRLVTVPKAELGEFVTVLSQTKMAAVEHAVRFALGLAG